MMMSIAHALTKPRRCRRGRRRLCMAAGLAGIVVSCLQPEGVFAAGRAIEDIRISKQGAVATVELSFPCAVRYLSHTPREAGANFQIRLALEEGCRAEIGSGLRSELYQPQGRDIAQIHELAFHTDASDGAILIVSFDRSAKAEVSQGRSRDVIRLLVETERRRLTEVPSTEAPRPTTDAPTSANVPLPQPARALPLPSVDVSPPPLAETAESKPEVPDREPLRLVQPQSRPAERYVVQLGTDLPLAEVVPPANVEDRTLYVNEVTAGRQSWTELRLGFFESEAAAGPVLNGLIGDFPDAVIALASVEEQTRGQANPFVLSDTPSNEGASVMPAASPAPDATGEGIEPLSNERAAELVEEARNALLAQDYDRGIQIYTRLLEDPAYGGRREARELLGVARQRNGQLAHAKAEYQAYLAEFPDGPEAQRVRQRLAGLATAADPPTQTLRADRMEEPRGWDFSGGVSQYYRQDVIRLRDDEQSIVGQAGLNSRVDLVARRQGERFDLLSRVNAGYYYDMRAEDRRPEDQGLISNAYLEITDQDLDLSAIVGRQSLYKSGVLGRFDGAHVSYQWKPDIALNFTTGFPVDSPRHAASTDRNFYSMSADLDDLWGSWDFSFFGHLQRVDGIADREAVGGEAHYRDERWSLVGALDLDLSYEVLNSALFVANWRATDRITLNGRLNVRAAPFLTTRNALMGQPVDTIEDMLRSFTEPQIRRLARDRTAQAQSASFGLSMPVWQRFQFNGDLTYTETEATETSGGVDLIPSTGPQYLYYANLVGSSFFKSGDTVIFGFRHTEALPDLITTLSFDVRLPMGPRLRLNPRIGLTLREGQTTRIQQVIASPRLRVIYRWGQRHRLEAELGGEWSNRDLPSLDPLVADTSEDSSEHFVNVGYWMEF